MEAQGADHTEFTDSAADAFLVDAHVHFYDCFDQTRFFEGALANFRAAAQGTGASSDPAGCLLFTESAGYNHFHRFREEGDGGAGPWRFRDTGEASSLLAVRNGADRLLLVAGRQIVAREDLEVLALGCPVEIPDRMSLRETLSAVAEQEAVAVIPWGFGKWWFGRGRIMAELLGDADASGIYLGDNSGRPGFLPGPRLFDQARAREILILPGTDPLPFPGEAGQAGSFGFVLPGRLDPSRPTASLLQAVRAQTTQPATYGRLEGLVRFCRHQVAMQLRKRVRKLRGT